MPTPRRADATRDLDAALTALRDRLDVPAAFPPEVEAAARDAAARGPAPAPREDATAIPLVTIDPPGSRDLDQAVSVEPGDAGALRVRYAIADVAAFVQPGDPVDDEAWARGLSRYSPDRTTPLHPPVLSEGAASLLPDVERPAVLHTIEVDGRGELVRADVRRAVVRSRRQLTYAQAQAAIDAGGDPSLTALSRLGRLRLEREWVRGGVSLELPEQEVVRDADGGYALRHRAPLPVERWNAQVSLLTGHAVGRAMAAAGVGVLRTLPAPDPAVVDDLRRRAWALGLAWPPEVGYPDFVRTLDPHEPAHAAMISTAAVGLRGAGYAAVDAAAGLPLPDPHVHAGVAAVYAHVTAPLRRLVDRYAAEVALAISAGTPVPGWVRERLPDLPRAMQRAGGRAGALDRAVVDLVEAHVLADRVGAELAAVVVRTGERGSDLQVRDPAVAARVPEQLPLGAEVHVRVAAVDLAAGTVTWAPA